MKIICLIENLINTEYRILYKTRILYTTVNMVAYDTEFIIV